MTPIISIIIPCYNSEKYISETLDCLRKQTIQNWECIIVNDGSTDNSLKIIKEYSQIDSRYIVIDKENGGPAKARNLAVEKSSGKYILPLDSDDLIDSTYAEKAVKYLEEHDDVKLVYSLCNFFGERTSLFYTEEYDYKKFLWNNCIVCSAVYRKSDFDKTCGYNPNMEAVYEDWDFWLSLLNENDKVYRIPEVLFFYRIHGVSRNTKPMDVFYKAQRTLVNNHLDKYGPYMDDIIRYYNEAQAFDAVVNSLSFKLGHRLLRPLSIIKQFLKR